MIDNVLREKSIDCVIQMIYEKEIHISQTKLVLFKFFKVYYDSFNAYIL